VIFVSALMPQEMEQRITNSGHEIVRIPASNELQKQGADWHETPLSNQGQLEDGEATNEALGTIDWLVVDHYLLDQRWTGGRYYNPKALVIDDLANRHYGCTLLVDQTLGRLASDYRDLVPAAARVLAGSAYALIRPEFQRERERALQRRREDRPARCVLVSMGTTDPDGITTQIVRSVLENAPECAVDVVLATGAQSLPIVEELARRHPEVTIHVDSHHMARLMLDAYIAIGAAGTTSWERCCLGLPTIALVLAENQRPSAAALAKAGAVISVERAEDVGLALRQLLDQPHRLSQMSAAAFPITDGQGAARVASAIFGDRARYSDTIALRPATHADMELLWLWRNDPVTRAQSRNTEPISWKSHVRWVSGALVDPARKILIGECGGTPVGNVAFHQVDGATDVSIVVAPADRGCGVGRVMLSAACAEMTGDIYAAVRIGNDASRRLFESCGFERVESSEPGFLRYLRGSVRRQRKQA